jgi:hypothetical protein
MVGLLSDKDGVAKCIAWRLPSRLTRYAINTGSRSSPWSGIDLILLLAVIRPPLSVFAWIHKHTPSNDFFAQIVPE